MDALAHGRLSAQSGSEHSSLFERILEDKPHSEMGYRGCLGIIRLLKKYSAERTEAATLWALLTGACRYKSIQSILNTRSTGSRWNRHPTLSPPVTTTSAAPPISMQA